MKITESQLKNALNAYFKCEAGDGLMNINMRAAIESLGIEVIPDPIQSPSTASKRLGLSA